MKAMIKIGSGNRLFILVFLILVMIGVYLRLNQYTLQVLLDDEWHVIHQLLKKTPGMLFRSLGHADFSIPLALLYWLEQKLFGLSELGMRWPTMVAGLTSLVVFPMYVRKHLGDKTALIFAGLLAISPMLIIYSRHARPYALTLLLSLMALGFFKKYIDEEKSSWGPGLAYVLCAASSVWLHLISLPVVIAPFLAYGLPALIKHDWVKVRRMLWLGLCAASVMSLLVLPPVLANPHALAVKLGAQLPNLQTYYGALFTWLGTSSPVVVVISVLLAVYGLGRAWRSLPIVPSLVTGLVLTLAVILLTQPAWVNHPLTLARYLLAFIPLFLLSIASGVARISDMLIIKWGYSGRVVMTIVIMTGLLCIAYYSPLSRILAKPNSNSLHSVYLFDFREEENLILQYQADFPVSPFWHMLTSLPVDSLKIAAGPFAFETYHWDAARWEQISRQRVMPAYLNGFCTELRKGEVPEGRGFKFKNAAYLSDQGRLTEQGFDLLVFQKPFKVKTKEGEAEFGMDTLGCEDLLRERYPSPVFEDEWLVVFPMSQDVRERVNAAGSGIDHSP